MTAETAIRCDHWTTPDRGLGERCTADGEVYLLAPDGRRVPGGPLCREHAEACVAEYAAKLGQTWRCEEAR